MMYSLNEANLYLLHAYSLSSKTRKPSPLRNFNSKQQIWAKFHTNETIEAQARREERKKKQLDCYVLMSN